MTLPLPDFRLETHLAKWEFAAKYHMTASDAQSMSIADLLALDDRDPAEIFGSCWLGYTETYGDPELRELISGTYNTLVPQDILCFAGAEEGLYAAMRVLLSAGDHAIVITPNYQSAETVPLQQCTVSGVALDEANGWALDLDLLAKALRPETKLISINFPHNPTGKILSADEMSGLIALCRQHDLWLFSDEVYWGLGADPAKHQPQIADLYEKGLSLNVLSKAYGLPGLRIGWIACRDHALLSRLERYKHYLSICNSAPSEALAKIALRHRDTIVGRNNRLIAQNLEHLDSFFAQHVALFDWYRPDGGCVAYPRYRGPGTVDAFCQKLVQDSGVLLLPAGIYQSDLGPVPSDRFRIGCGRAGLAEGLKAFSDHIAKMP